MKPIHLLSLIVLLAGSAPFIPVLRAADPPAAPGQRPAFRNATVEQFDKLRAETNHVVLDVRTKKEFDGGHIPGAINVDWNGPDFARQVAALDPGKTYLVHCAGGVRSVKACNAMSKLKFTNLVNLEPGFKAWEKAGKPVKK